MREAGALISRLLPVSQELPAKEDVLDQLISQSASYVESVAGADEHLIHSAGMDTRMAPSAPLMPDLPAALEVTIGDHEGELDLSWDKVAGARS